MKTIVIQSRKGGSGKTSTVNALGCGLALRGYKVLIIDLDAQKNLSTSLLGANIPETTMYDVLTGAATLNKAIVPIRVEGPDENGNTIADGDSNLWLGASCTKMDLLDGVIAADPAKSMRKNVLLYEALKPLRDNDFFDYCLIDTPNSLGTCTTNAMMAADYCLITVKAAVFSEEGTVHLMEKLDEVREYKQEYMGGKDIIPIGLLITQYKTGTNTGALIAEEFGDYAKELDTKKYDVKIRDCIHIEDAYRHITNIFIDNPKSNVAIDYNEFVEEFIKREKASERKAKRNAKKGD
jgi:chromosome partitioning protein